MPMHSMQTNKSASSINIQINIIIHNTASNGTDTVHCRKASSIKWQDIYGSKNGIILSALGFLSKGKNLAQASFISNSSIMPTPAADLFAHVTCASLCLRSTKCHLPWTPTMAKNPPNGAVSLAGQRKQPSVSYWAEINATEELHRKEKYIIIKPFRLPGGN